MDAFEAITSWFLPGTEDMLLRGRAGLIIATCMAVAAALLGMLVVWAISRDLDRPTMAGSTSLIVLLAGLGFLAQRGQVTLAAWLLVSLLTFLMGVDTFIYGITSLTTSALVLPILVAACSLGLGPALLVATVASGFVWFLAWGGRAGWHVPRLGRNTIHLTFYAPGLTALFYVMALLAGGWTEYTMRMVIGR